MITAGTVAAAATALLNESIEAPAVTNLSGDAQWRMQTKAGVAFVKTMTADLDSPFPAEAAGLHELRKTGAIRVPDVWAVGSSEQLSLIVMEWLDLRPGSAASDAVLGSELASMHRATAPRFGWHSANTLGASPQYNAWSDSWAEFFRDQRLRYQLHLATTNAGASDIRWIDRGRRLCDGVGELLEGRDPRPALLHGDLWSGNRATTADGRPVIFDPAVYFGDREADIAMTRLFGGFSAAFYEAYEKSWPIEPGFKVRETLYNLYHVLNHFNLFGAGYRGQAQDMIDRLLAELGR
jgi:fructosamine-3-kinase